MTQHNIIGSEQSGEHVVVRYAPAKRRSAFWWARTIIEGAVCLGIVAMIWGALS